MYATAGPRCAVKIFREYLTRRPPETNSGDAPFFLAAITNPACMIWYKKQPLGENSLGSFMKSISKAKGLTTRHTNHSVRRTVISAPRKENVVPLNIIALAGQINPKSLDSYSSTSIEQQIALSPKLSKFIEDSEARKTPVEGKILSPPAASK